MFTEAEIAEQQVRTDATQGRSLHWTQEEATRANDVATDQCIHGVPVNVFCGKCES